MNMRSYSCCSLSSKESSKIQIISKLLQVVSEDRRLKILCLLSVGSHCVCELMEHLNLSQSLISHHLKDLRVEGIVTSKKQGLYMHYSLTKKGRKVAKLLFSLV